MTRPSPNLDHLMSLRYSVELTAADFLPTDPPSLAPAVMTAMEAGIYLRLDRKADGTLRASADIVRSIDHLVAKHGLRPLRVGRHTRFSKSELDRWIRDRTEVAYAQSDPAA